MWYVVEDAEGVWLTEQIDEDTVVLCGPVSQAVAERFLSDELSRRG